jgi:hypothetical protein
MRLLAALSAVLISSDYDEASRQRFEQIKTRTALTLGSEEMQLPCVIQ